MSKRVDLFYSTYSHFSDRVLREVRQDTFGVDIGQNSWQTVEELDRFLGWLALSAEQRVLEIASGSGGPASYVVQQTGCHVTGIDANEYGVANATEMASKAGQSERLRFMVADANARLPFDDDHFDALICMDSMNHFPDRLSVFKEWRRVLRTGGRAVFTDPVVITGAVTNDELAVRSSIGLFVFVPPGLNELFIEQAGLRIVRHEDVTANAALISGRWQQAREARRHDLVRIEGEERFTGVQRFLHAVHRLTSERRLSRIVYLAEKE